MTHSQTSILKRMQQYSSSHKSIEIKADLVSTLVGYTETKTHSYAIPQSCDKAFRKLQMLQKRSESYKCLCRDYYSSFLLLVVALNANNLRMFLLQAMHVCRHFLSLLLSQR